MNKIIYWIKWIKAKTHWRQLDVCWCLCISPVVNSQLLQGASPLSQWAPATLIRRSIYGEWINWYTIMPQDFKFYLSTQELFTWLSLYNPYHKLYRLPAFNCTNCHMWSAWVSGKHIFESVCTLILYIKFWLTAVSCIGMWWQSVSPHHWRRSSHLPARRRGGFHQQHHPQLTRLAMCYSKGKLDMTDWPHPPLSHKFHNIPEWVSSSYLFRMCKFNMP